MRKTLTEMDDAAALERETAARYEQLINERDTLVRAVNKLQPQIDDVAGLTALEHIAKLAEQIPIGVQTRGSRFVPGGLLAKDVVASTAANALLDIQVRRADLISTMEQVKARQVRNAERLKEFGE